MIFNMIFLYGKRVLFIGLTRVTSTAEMNYIDFRTFSLDIFFGEGPNQKIYMYILLFKSIMQNVSFHVCLKI